MKYLARRLGILLGTLGYYLFKRRRQLALDNINQAFKKNIPKNKIIIKQSFINLGLNFIEFLQLSKITKHTLPEYITIHNIDYLQKIYSRQKGVLILTAHLGNWELLAVSMALSGFKTSMIVKKAHQKYFDNFLSAQRKSKNITLFYGKNSIRHILKFLKSGGLVGVILDQHAHDRDSIIVPFFNRPAATLKSLAILSAKTGAPVIPIYTYRDKNFHHHIIIEPEIISPENSTEYTRTEQYNAWLEKVITEHSDQWMWTHRRWKVKSTPPTSSSRGE